MKAEKASVTPVVVADEAGKVDVAVVAKAKGKRTNRAPGTKRPKAAARVATNNSGTIADVGSTVEKVAVTKPATVATPEQRFDAAQELLKRTSGEIAATLAEGAVRGFDFAKKHPITTLGAAAAVVFAPVTMAVGAGAAVAAEKLRPGSVDKAKQKANEVVDRAASEARVVAAGVEGFFRGLFGKK